MHRKNNSTVFIFGAGVSKAVAGAPVMKELFLKMKARYEYEKKRPDCPERKNRVLSFERSEKLIEKLEIEAGRRLHHIKEDKNMQMKSDIRENIEYLITLLDIHTEYGTTFDLKKTWHRREAISVYTN